MKRGRSKTIKIMLKYAVYCLGFGLLQLSNCCLEDLKTWSNCNIGWEGIPLDNDQWKERVFIVVLASMNLTECHRMTIPGDPMCGLHSQEGTLPPGHLQFCRKGRDGPQIVSLQGSASSTETAMK